MGDVIVAIVILLLLAVGLVEALTRLHPAGAAKLQSSRTFRAWRYVLLAFTGLVVIVLIVVGAVFGIIAIVQDIGPSDSGCTSANCVNT